MVKVVMTYNVRYNTLDEVYDCVVKLRQAREAVKSNDLTIDCEFNFAPGHSEPLSAFWVGMISDQPASLEHALRGYVKIAGTPDLIVAGSDYALAKKVLRAFGKNLNEGGLDSFVGKRVEPVNASGQFSWLGL